MSQIGAGMSALHERLASTPSEKSAQESPKKTPPDYSDPTWEPLDAQTLERIKRQMTKEDAEVVVYWRLPAPPGGEKKAYTCAAYTVDYIPVVPARPGQEADDDYAWLCPADDPEKCEAWPQDGRNGNDLYEYAWVGVEGASVIEPKKAKRTKPSRSSLERSTQQAEGPRDSLDDLAVPNFKKGLAGDPADADRPANAEDPATWPKFLCTKEPATNMMNLHTMMAYYRRQFGAERVGGVVGKGAEEKTATEETLQRIFSAMKALMAQRNIGENEEWKKGLYRDLAHLDLKRDAANGASKRLVDAMAREYGMNAERPDWQKEARKAAQDRVRAEVASYDPNVTTQAQRQGEDGGRGGGRGGGRVGLDGGGRARLSKKARAERAKAYKELGDKPVKDLTPSERKKLGF